jgi:2-polyprenyl-3-methyl-5-hydroxy-6-metoxy-1,4-benzoquinol methylase
MTPDDKRSAARELSAQYEKTANPLGWFDALYKNAAGHPEKIPWAELRPNPYLLQWLDTAHLSPRKALVIGSGLGDDAEFLTSRSWTTTAFDISPEAINWSRRRFPNSKVDYQIASVLEPPATWRNKFDLVVEIFTLQALPRPLHLQAIPKIAELIAPSGRLFLFARARNESDPPGSMPWPLTEKEIKSFENRGLQSESFEDFLDEEDPPVRRFKVVMRRP